jgi:hypothetical protein
LCAVFVGPTKRTTSRNLQTDKHTNAHAGAIFLQNMHLRYTSKQINLLVLLQNNQTNKNIINKAKRNSHKQTNKQTNKQRNITSKAEEIAAAVAEDVEVPILHLFQRR